MIVDVEVNGVAHGLAKSTRFHSQAVGADSERNEGELSAGSGLLGADEARANIGQSHLGVCDRRATRIQHCAADGSRGLTLSK